DTSAFALRPGTFSLTSLVREVFDPASAQPSATTKAQASAWKHWEAWCALNRTPPWRLCRPVSDADFHREAVLQAGFLRFTHVRQSARPRGHRAAALPSSADKALRHIRRMHKDRNYEMVASTLVTQQIRRMHYEYVQRYPASDLIPRRKEPFTREILVDVILKAPEGFDLGSFSLRWGSRAGRSLRALTTTLAQTGFRKGEVCVEKAGQPCSYRCASRASLRCLLRGRIYLSCPPASLLQLPVPGDFAILVPPPSKSDPFDMVWGGNPVWLPFQPGEPLCAFSALADVELYDPVSPSADPASVALFTLDDGAPFSGSQLDAILRRLLLRCLPASSASLYSWHSARIFLATMLLQAGASHAEIQALCRWQTDESLKIYARLDASKYASFLNRAMAARVATARTYNLAVLEPGRCRGLVRLPRCARAPASARPRLLH
ncbi:MAG: hypothetical protein SGPRY_006234, partial [Prymnesium sp.]